uniref:Uncharacterized protein n=1 Tax=Arundo donax TaxID=35708 RepID=A0A0A9G595_ARUDO
MSSADELFHNGQIHPVCLAAALLEPQRWRRHGGGGLGAGGGG